MRSMYSNIQYLVDIITYLLSWQILGNKGYFCLVYKKMYIIFSHLTGDFTIFKINLSSMNMQPLSPDRYECIINQTELSLQ